MRLSSLLESLPGDASAKHIALASDDPIIRGITYDSRQVAPGDLFVAFSGSAADGHDYLPAAVELGAAALLVENAERTRDVLASVARAVPTVAVRDARRAMAPLATRFFGDPASELCLIGITGTNGKTSTAYLTESMLKSAGTSTGLIGTVEIRYAREKLRAINTTPESLDLQRLLRAMRTSRVDAVVMEVSSHGLELGRVAGCSFRVGAITNLTQDHLDFHGNMRAYLDSKLRLFREYLAPEGAAVINLDDPSAPQSQAAAEQAGSRVIRATREAGREAEVRLLDAQVKLDGTRARIALPEAEIDLQLPLLGDFNLENALVACGIAVALELPTAAIVEGIAQCPQVPGRMELVRSERSSRPTVIVDYAHTPDAVEKLLAAVRPLARGRLITLFGCGGDRDRAKRPLMAEAVARYSDRVVATSDNPRTEDPLQILHDVEVGLAGLERVEPDQLDSRDGCYAVAAERRMAIRCAIEIARPEDTVVLAGKGHEDYQIIGTEKLPFDDREEAARALADWGEGSR
jgi:UDP-N-acetylmuramoyl-L-alanyl-D-glutamate--2,6-diaminopimelate ligase